MYGGKDGEETSGKVWLEGNFDRGRTAVCSAEIGSVLSPLSRIDVGHDNSGPGAGWHLDRVRVMFGWLVFIYFFYLSDLIKTRFKSVSRLKKKKIFFNFFFLPYFILIFPISPLFSLFFLISPYFPPNFLTRKGGMLLDAIFSPGILF